MVTWPMCSVLGDRAGSRRDTDGCENLGGIVLEIKPPEVDVRPLQTVSLVTTTEKLPL